MLAYELFSHFKGLNKFTHFTHLQVLYCLQLNINISLFPKKNSGRDFSFSFFKKKYDFCLFVLFMKLHLHWLYLIIYIQYVPILNGVMLYFICNVWMVTDISRASSAIEMMSSILKLAFQKFTKRFNCLYLHLKSAEIQSQICFNIWGKDGPMLYYYHAACV